MSSAKQDLTGYATPLDAMSAPKETLVYVTVI